MKRSLAIMLVMVAMLCLSGCGETTAPSHQDRVNAALSDEDKLDLDKINIKTLSSELSLPVIKYNPTITVDVYIKDGTISAEGDLSEADKTGVLDAIKDSYKVDSYEEVYNEIMKMFHMDVAFEQGITFHYDNNGGDAWLTGDESVTSKN